jgi:hypothetical protein
MGVLSLVLAFATQASTIKIMGPKVIDQFVSYQNVSLDLSEGYFDIKESGQLEIKNSLMVGTISKKNPSFFKVTNGKLLLSENELNVHVAADILPQPSQLTYTLIDMQQGNVDITHNDVVVDQSYSVGFLFGYGSQNTRVLITHNKIHNFHGGIVLTGFSNILLSFNELRNISSTNLYVANSHSVTLDNNHILFAGNNNIGDAIDIINTTDFMIKNNFIASDSCYAIVILGGKNGVIALNHIVGGITYAIFIDSSFDSHLYLPNTIKTQINENSNITVNRNYMAQNRFGLSAAEVDGLFVKENVFIQKFSDNASRQFWTDNKILLRNVSNLLWENNIYKEAFSQENDDINVKSNHFVIFPTFGGVNL